MLAATFRGPVDAAYGGGRVAAGASAGRCGPDGRWSTDSRPRWSSGSTNASSVPSTAPPATTLRSPSDSAPRYREFKGQELDAIVGDTLAAAWALGVYDATPRGATLRWVAAVEGQCPDCDDNALEPTVKGEPFPTGQPHPPAHPGCRCLLVPQS